MPRLGPVSLALLAGMMLVMSPYLHSQACPVPSPASPNSLSADAQAQGWRLLFDGTSLDAWRGYRMDSMPAGWSIVDGTITRTGPGGDIITREQFDSFVLGAEWRVAPGGNSGIMYRVTEAEDYSYKTGPEFQILDNARHADGASPLTSAGAAYGLYPAPVDAPRPAGEWNQACIVIEGNHVQHWLNGRKGADYELGSADWEARVKQSKFVQWPGYGRAARGHIALQDHGDRVAYRNLVIRRLP